MSTKTITIPHLYRVEGHGGIEVSVGEKGVESCQMNIFEGSRYYEVLLRGHKFYEVPGIICRVCAICSAAHTLCSIEALEDALGMKATPAVEKIRKLLNMGEFIESHALHLFCLAAPDYLGFTGVIEMNSQFQNEVSKALMLKKYGNTIQEKIGGRAIHPVNMLIGGVGKWPSKEVFRELREGAQQALEILHDFEPFIADLPQPDYANGERTYIALKGEDDGLCLSLGKALYANGFDPVPVTEYSQYVNESVVAHSTAKQSRFSDKPFMVGALSRLVHHHKSLKGDAAVVYQSLLPEQLPPNPLLNNAAQFVELVYCCEEVIRLCNELTRLPAEPKPAIHPPSPRETTTGTAAMEVPRGTLFHSYTINESGIITDADIITPTSQNLAQVEIDIGSTVNHWIESDEAGGKEQLKSELEMLARAYDPCISCSTHLIDLKFHE